MKCNPCPIAMRLLRLPPFSRILLYSARPHSSSLRDLAPSPATTPPETPLTAKAWDFCRQPVLCNTARSFSPRVNLFTGKKVLSLTKDLASGSPLPRGSMIPLYGDEDKFSKNRALSPGNNKILFY